MTFFLTLAEDLLFIAIVLLWAKGAKLDLGLRRSVFPRDVWPWIALYLAWYLAEWIHFTLWPAEENPVTAEALREWTLPGSLVLMVVTGPLFEELLFRGALFTALLRRWGFWPAAIVTSLLWGLIHIGYEPWFIVSIAGSGVLLAMIRHKTGSIYIPLVLHAFGNLLVTIDNYIWLASIGG
jgi:uncharacterized protein